MMPSKAPASGWRNSGQSGQSRAHRGTRAGCARGKCGWESTGAPVAAGEVRNGIWCGGRLPPTGSRHGALEKSATLCLCEASQHGAPRGSRCWLQPCSAPAASPAPPHRQQPRQEQPGASRWETTRAAIEAGEISCAAGSSEAAGSDPRGCSRIPALLPEEREQAGSASGRNHGEALRGAAAPGNGAAERPWLASNALP